MTNVGSRSLKEFPESAVMRPILLYAHLLQRLAYLHSRQTHLATESRHDVGSGEIYRFLVLAGLAITRRDEFARYIRRLISPVALVELRNLTSVKPIPESRVEKMTYLGIYQTISLFGYRCSTFLVPCSTLRRYRLYHSVGTGTINAL